MRVTASLLDEHCNVFSQTNYFGSADSDLAAVAPVVAKAALTDRGFVYDFALRRFFGDDQKLPAFVDVELTDWAPGGNQVAGRRCLTYRLVEHLIATAGIPSATGSWHRVTDRMRCWSLAAV